MRLFRLVIAFALAMAGFADTVTLRDGRVLNGNYLGGTPRQVRLDMGDHVETLDVGNIVRIEFGGPARSGCGSAKYGSRSGPAGHAPPR